MDKKLHELMAKYEERFKDVFPNEPSDLTIKEQMDIIEECLMTGKPYDPMEGLPPDVML